MFLDFFAPLSVVQVLMMLAALYLGVVACLGTFVGLYLAWYGADRYRFFEVVGSPVAFAMATARNPVRGLALFVYWRHILVLTQRQASVDDVGRARQTRRVALFYFACVAICTALILLAPTDHCGTVGIREALLRASNRSTTPTVEWSEVRQITPLTMNPLEHAQMCLAVVDSKQPDTPPLIGEKVWYEVFPYQGKWTVRITPEMQVKWEKRSQPL